MINTKFKGTYPNDNPVKLGHYRVTVKEGGLFKFLPWNVGETIHVESLSGDVVSQDVATNTYYEIRPTLKTVLDISGKYLNIIDVAGEYAKCDINDLCYFPGCIYFALIAPSDAEYLINGSIEKLTQNSTVIRRFNIRNNGFFGDISCLAGKLNLGSSDSLNVSYNNLLEGDLSSLLNETSYGNNQINISGTKITLSQATLAAFTAKGVTVIYDQNQLID